MTCIAVHPSGRLLVSVGKDRTVRSVLALQTKMLVV